MSVDIPVMPTPSAAIESQQGEYEWGVRDCCTTSIAVLSATYGKLIPADYSYAWSISEKRCMQLAYSRHGDIGPAHISVLTKDHSWPHVVLDCPAELIPGSVVFPFGRCEYRVVRSGVVIKTEICWPLFVDNECNTWSWTVGDRALERVDKVRGHSRVVTCVSDYYRQYLTGCGDA